MLGISQEAGEKEKNPQQRTSETVITTGKTGHLAGTPEIGGECAQN
jgi:hypothetical protein